jgi:NitT/TauT family transport system ATP-binding protein
MKQGALATSVVNIDVLAAVAHDTAPAKLELRGVSRKFNSRSGDVNALENVSLRVRPGEFVCIVGPSGCGKSTLLNLFAGLDEPSSGKVLMEGRAIHGPGPERLVMFQEHGLFPWLSVRKNVEFGLRLKGVTAERRREIARHWLRVVHLDKFEDSYIHQLSGGMKQRVALARSLAMDPEVLLMDEPFTALDAQSRDLLHEELEQVWSSTGKTIVFVTHNVREAVRLGDRVILMTFRPGRIMKDFRINLARERHVEDVDVAATAKELMAYLRADIDRAFEDERPS